MHVTALCSAARRSSHLTPPKCWGPFWSRHSSLSLQPLMCCVLSVRSMHSQGVHRACAESELFQVQDLRKFVTSQLDAHSAEATRAAAGVAWVRGWDDYKKPSLTGSKQ